MAELQIDFVTMPPCLVKFAFYILIVAGLHNKAGVLLAYYPTILFTNFPKFTLSFDAVFLQHLYYEVIYHKQSCLNQT